MTWTPEAYVADQFERGRRAWVKQQIPLLAQEYPGDHDGLLAALGSLEGTFRAYMRSNIEGQETARRRRYRAALDALNAVAAADPAART